MGNILQTVSTTISNLSLFNQYVLVIVFFFHFRTLYCWVFYLNECAVVWRTQKKVTFIIVAFIWLLANHVNYFLVMPDRFSNTSVVVLLTEYGVVQSAQFAKWLFSSPRNRPHRKILNNRELSIEPCGTPEITSSQSL